VIGTRDIDDAVLNFEPLIDLHGSVTIEGEAAPDFSPRPGQPPNMTMQVGLSSARGPKGAPGYMSDIRSGIGSDGSFTLTGIAPGLYEVRVSGLPGTWMKSIRLGTLEAMESRIEISETSAAIPLQLTLARSVGRISGIVLDDRGNPAGRGTLILLRDPPGPNSVTMLSGVGEDGRFMLSPVPPGTYRAYAWEDIEDAQRYDPDLLKAWENSSVTVTVKENGSEEITLRQIPSQDPFVRLRRQ